MYISESSPTSSVWASVGFDWVDHPESPVRHVVIGGQRVQMAGGHGQPEPIGDGMPHLAHEDWGDLSTKIVRRKPDIPDGSCFFFLTFCEFPL